MPINASFDDALRITILHCHGKVTRRDFELVYNSVAANANLAGTHALFDTSECELKLAKADIRILAEKPALFRRMAILAPEPVAYGLARMFEILAEGRREVAVFSDRSEALAWLSSARE